MFISEYFGFLKKIRLLSRNVFTLWYGPQQCKSKVQEQTTGNIFLTFPGYIGLLTLPNTLNMVAGSPTVLGFRDGTFTDSLFESPLGLTFLSDYILLLADSTSKRLRVLDLKSSTSSSICSGITGYDDGNLTFCCLISPYSVRSVGNTVFVGDLQIIKIIKLE